MLRKTLLTGLAVTLMALLTCSEASAWGVARVNYTRSTPYGSYSTSRTYASGAYGRSYYGGRSVYGSYGGGYRSYHSYSPSYYGGYYGGGVRYGYGGYRY